jgi:hypothetical protein
MLAVACGACSASPAPSPVESGIAGVTVVDAGCPVLRDGERCPEHPIRANLVVTRPDSTEIVARSHSGADGTFRIRLPPGTYLLRPTNATGAPLPTAQPVTVEVRERGFTAVRVRFDSGVR